MTTASIYQWQTLIGSIAIVFCLALAWRCHIVTSSVALLGGVIAGAQIAFYVWLFYFAMPGEYAWLSAALRAFQTLVALALLIAHILHKCRNHHCPS